MEAKVEEIGAEIKKKTKHRETPSDRRWAIILTIYSVIVLALTMSLFLSYWNLFQPAFLLIENNTATTNGPRAFVMHTALGWPWDIRYITVLSPETLIMTVMMLAGMMGACIFSLWGIADHMGFQKDFDASW